MFKRKYLVILLSLMSVGSMALLYFNQGQMIARDQIEIGMVQTGEFIRTSEGFGQFESQQDRVITTPFNGRVTAINFLSGESVNQGDILFTLENTDLIRKLTNAEMDLQRSKLLYQKLEIDLSQLQINLKNNIADKKSDLVIAQLNEKAQHKLYQKKITSELKYLKIKAQLVKITRKLAALESDFIVQKNNNAKQLKIESSLIAQDHSKVLQYQADIEKMNIKSPIKGVIQQIKVTIGDSLTIGGILGRVGATYPDVAKLKFSAQDAKGLTVGSDVELVYLNHNFSSTIDRIEPELSDGYIIAYVDLSHQQLPDAKIELNLVAKTIIERVSNVTWVKRPVASQSQSDKFVVFKIVGNKAIKQLVEVKTVYNHFLIIKSGLKDNDKIITSNIREFEQLDEIEIQ